FAAQVPYSAGYTPASVTVGDMNGDGKLDLAVPNTNGNTVSVLLGKGDGTFASQLPYPSVALARSSVVEDLNGDGKLDLAIAGGLGVSVLLSHCLP
ncbi:MAG TPA: VCBS repeat-containing protein, partial [Polyangiaceae bacterium]|nr:VCBS repeat-containing protein [Polyangiaceae bacterium]